jgi:adenosyl cobinamide kinase/adenosyl cobinamide phosphate guanylyltransferase
MTRRGEGQFNLDVRIPIEEAEQSVSYLGVALKKAENRGSQFVPNPEQYTDFINDSEVALPLQRDIAVAFLNGDPLLVDGGTSLGKTTTVRKMCADLGYEVHYVNLNGASDVEDLMGRYIPNPHKKSAEDPEYLFADGKVTSGLRQEEGKVKVIILDEFNASAPNILIRLHEVLDALERGTEVILAEDASEAVRVNKQSTKVVALMNPPGKGYFGREPLDPAQLRRWVYKKLPSELPAGTFSHSTDALFGIGQDQPLEIPESAYLEARDQALTSEQLQEIPGITEILAKYKEFHKASKEMLKARKMAQDQPQPFTFDDRMEPRRVRDFILRFYNGDINETFQQALRFFYENKLESDVDRKKLGELIRTVEFKTSATSSKRIPINGVTPESKGVVGISPEIARDIISPEFFFGKNEIKNAFGFEATEIPLVPYTPEQLETARTNGEILVLRVGMDGSGKSMTMEHIQSLTKDRLGTGQRELFFDTDWYEEEAFFKDASLKTEWKLVGETVLTDSVSKNYIEQTKILRDHLAQLGDLTLDELEECRDSELAEIQTRLNKGEWQEVALALSTLKINMNHRRSPVEVIYDWAVVHKNKDRRLLERVYDWTNAVSSGGLLVYVGYVESRGANVYYDEPDGQGSVLGVVCVR